MFGLRRATRPPIFETSCRYGLQILPGASSALGGPVHSSCDAKANMAVIADPSSPTSLNFTSAAGAPFVVHVDSLHQCDHASVSLYPRVPVKISPSQLDNVEEALGVWAFVHVFTSSRRNGEACLTSMLAVEGNCTVLTRPLPLSLDVQSGRFIGRFVPDPAAEHYRISVEVRACTAAVCVRSVPTARYHFYCSPVSRQEMLVQAVLLASVSRL